jgi:hypothetical protein
MPTPAQINAAATNDLVGTPPKMKPEAQADLLVYLRQYLVATKRTGGYTQLSTKIAAAQDRQAAQLQAVLNNIGGSNIGGNKKAGLTGEVTYTTDENFRAELEFALFVMYEPVAVNTLATSESEMAQRIRNHCGCRQRGCAECFDEYRRTVSNC